MTVSIVKPVLRYKDTTYGCIGNRVHLIYLCSARLEAVFDILNYNVLIAAGMIVVLSIN